METANVVSEKLVLSEEKIFEQKKPARAIEPQGRC